MPQRTNREKRARRRAKKRKQQQDEWDKEHDKATAAAAVIVRALKKWKKRHIVPSDPQLSVLFNIETLEVRRMSRSSQRHFAYFFFYAPGYNQNPVFAYDPQLDYVDVAWEGDLHKYISANLMYHDQKHKEEWERQPEQDVEKVANEVYASIETFNELNLARMIAEYAVDGFNLPVENQCWCMRCC